jgi:hypothetical protein
MKTLMMLAAAVAASSGPAAARADSEVEELRQRIEKLEQAAAAGEAAKQGDGISRIDSRIEWKGDFRYRHENIDREEAARDRDRHRIRARFGLTGRVNDTVSATVRLATGGGSDDPRSTNQTLGDGFDRKDLAIDLAYVDWRPLAGMNVLLGKMAQPWESVDSRIWDADLNPEGGALRYQNGAFFGSAFGYWLAENSSSAEATLTGAQLGLRGEAGGVKFTAALGYFDVGAVQGRITTAAPGCAPSGAFFGGPQGNTAVSTGGCARLANDFNMVEVLAQAQFKVGGQPLTLFVDVMRNQEAAALDTARSAGFRYGKASAPRSWEFGYTWQSMEKDAQFGQFVDSDFGDGATDAEGSVFRVAYAPAKNWVLSGTCFLNRRFVDVGTPRDYDRLQLDLIFKY